MGFKNEILKLRQGLPQDWIYIERTIHGNIQSNSKIGVLAPFGHKNQYLEDLFKEDLLNTYNQKIATIRPIIGPNGSGKTTQLKIQIKKYLKTEFKKNHIYLFYDFRHLAKNEDDFWFAFIQLLYERILEEDYLKYLCKSIPRKELKRVLFSTFKNSQIVEQVYNSLSEDDLDNLKAQKFFYGTEITHKEIRDFFYGFVNLALSQNRFVIICFDELQFLLEIDKSGTLLKFILEQFMRALLETYADKPLYLIFSCLDNPKHQEYSKLKEKSVSFGSIIQNMEMRLGLLTEEEKYQILDLVCDKVEMEKQQKTDFMRRLGRFKDMKVPRILLQAVAIALNKMGYEHISKAEIRSAYEIEARNFVSKNLQKKGFTFISPSETKIGGYKIDIHAKAATDRSRRVKQAFGEVTIAQKKSIKSKIEKFSNWLYRMRGKEYQPNHGDYAFFVCPKDRITKESQKLLRSNRIALYEFDSTVIDLITKLATNKKGVIKKKYEKLKAKSIVYQHVEDEIKEIGKIEYSLTQVSGIKQANLALLNEAGIFTIDDLLNCDVKVADKVKGLGAPSLVKWKQASHQLLEN